MSAKDIKWKNNLAGKRSIKMNGQEICTTPLLVPSFSSKGSPDIGTLIGGLEGTLTGPILISAYDLHYGKKESKIKLPVSYPEFIFIDSGGYEITKDLDLSDSVNYQPNEPQKWTPEMHLAVLKKWKSNVPSVFITFDDPEHKKSIKNQIKYANDLFDNFSESDVVREILIKPEPNKLFIDCRKLVQHIKSFSDFDILGFTEKEIGENVLDRMKNIAFIRRALQVERIDLPIHIFGSLDTVTTPLYFLAGADIFDGLSWLRFGFYEGHTIYQNSYGILRFLVKKPYKQIQQHAVKSNLDYIDILQMEMSKYLTEHKFKSFSFHPELFEKVFETMVADF